ncbi:MAG: class I SAM-dependent methyltransferase [Erysipelotrichaceae bacterium]|nr:class I SAM-dependent methyltransferase [Erysipelotrichaceae bacterium]MDY5252269.1 class I SAM-dependent methyltransferase [Erysipelotrichaceae bacterium]
MLNKRLQAVAKMVDKCDVVADIGCDHAFLAISLIENKQCSKVYATDVASGPLSIAQANVKSAQLTDKIECLLSDGFANIPDDVDVAIIAGMGYHTAIAILEAAMSRLMKMQSIIVQINTDVELFRKWLSDHRYTIIEEKIVFDRKYYTIIKFNLNNADCLDEIAIEFGPKLLQNKDEVFMQYNQKKLATYKMILAKITNDDAKKAFIQDKIALYEKVLNI